MRARERNPTKCTDGRTDKVDGKDLRGTASKPTMPTWRESEETLLSLKPHQTRPGYRLPASKTTQPAFVTLHRVAFSPMANTGPQRACNGVPRRVSLSAVAGSGGEWETAPPFGDVVQEFYPARRGKQTQAAKVNLRWSRSCEPIRKTQACAL